MKRFLAGVLLFIMLMGCVGAYAEEPVAEADATATASPTDLGCSVAEISEALATALDIKSYDINWMSDMSTYNALANLGVRAYYPYCYGYFSVDKVVFNCAIITDVNTKNANRFILTFKIDADDEEKIIAASDKGIACWNAVMDICTDDVKAAYASISEELGIDYYLHPKSLLNYINGWKQTVDAEGYNFTFKVEDGWASYILKANLENVETHGGFDIDEEVCEKFITAINYNGGFDFCNGYLIVADGPKDVYDEFASTILYMASADPDIADHIRIAFYWSELAAAQRRSNNRLMREYYLPDNEGDFIFRYKNAVFTIYADDPQRLIELTSACMLAWEDIYGNQLAE